MTMPVCSAVFTAFFLCSVIPQKATSNPEDCTNSSKGYPHLDRTTERRHYPLVPAGPLCADAPPDSLLSCTLACSEGSGKHPLLLPAAAAASHSCYSETPALPCEEMSENSICTSVHCAAPHPWVADHATERGGASAAPCCPASCHTICTPMQSVRPCSVSCKPNTSGKLCCISHRCTSCQSQAADLSVLAGQLNSPACFWHQPQYIVCVKTDAISAASGKQSPCCTCSMRIWVWVDGRAVPSWPLDEIALCMSSWLFQFCLSAVVPWVLWRHLETGLRQRVEFAYAGSASAQGAGWLSLEVGASLSPSHHLGHLQRETHP